ncbi:hypothetical protein DENIS_1526 [Desulfonema ishimotonii]|uniref:Uncharacterized protein n=1 Tax=Desulfonema ishimotonii TaxID=45657 RepID=A0A401FUC5_9BACT|nr:hypothetical protein [Desulfonema ishimotonii]GBC60569.1 hypothetical protein DENIS_1526 [Desulfonema ishimotonii]
MGDTTIINAKGNVSFAKDQARIASNEIREIVALLKAGPHDPNSKEWSNAILEKLGNAQQALLELQGGLFDLQDEKRTLKDTIAALEEKLRIKENVEYIKPGYWTVDGDKKDGPFCQRCYDADGKLIRLQGGKFDRWRCEQCNKTFYGPNYSHPKPRTLEVKW